MDRDEHYILALCDEVLNAKAKRQHRFPFLRGDPNADDRQMALPIDAFYEDLKLVVEYRECQHTEAVPFMDHKDTVSGVTRGEQRKLYDQRRRDVLPEHGIKLVELDYSMFAHGSNKRLKRDPEADKAIISQLLANAKAS